MLLAFQYGNLEMSNASAIAIAIAGILSIAFFVIASLTTDTKGLLEWSKQHLDEDD